jgi:hypothetical protein
MPYCLYLLEDVETGRELETGCVSNEELATHLGLRVEDLPEDMRTEVAVGFLVEHVGCAFYLEAETGHRNVFA